MGGLLDCLIVILFYCYFFLALSSFSWQKNPMSAERVTLATLDGLLQLQLNFFHE
jgi:hypothetical protein